MTTTLPDIDTLDQRLTQEMARAAQQYDESRQSLDQQHTLTRQEQAELEKRLESLAPAIRDLLEGDGGLTPQVARKGLRYLDLLEQQHRLRQAHRLSGAPKPGVRKGLVWVVRKAFDSNEPRVPAGQEGGGRWTNSGGKAKTGEAAVARMRRLGYIPWVPEDPDKEGVRAEAVYAFGLLIGHLDRLLHIHGKMVGGDPLSVFFESDRTEESGKPLGVYDRHWNAIRIGYTTGNALLHEMGHYLDAAAAPGAYSEDERDASWASTGKPEWKAFIAKVRGTPSFEKWFERWGEHGAAKVRYFNDPREIFARFFDQWAADYLYKHGVPAHHLDLFHDWHVPEFLSEADFNALKPHFDALMRGNGLIKALIGILKARDVSGEARVPAGSPHGGEWTKGPKAGEPHPQGYQPSTTESKGETKDNRAARAPKGVFEMLVSQIRVDPARFQFKSNTSQESGAGSELRDVRRWDPDLAGIVLVWKDPKNNKTYVVNGHHRLDLARRLKVRRVLVRYLNEPDERRARIKGAIVNIAEGRGTPMDAAKVFRESKMNRRDLDEAGVSLRGSLASQAEALSRLAPALFSQVATGKMPEGRGAAIGRAFATETEQLALADMLKRPEIRRKNLSDSAIEELARFVQTAGRRTQTILTLFGEESLEKNLAVEKAQVSAVLRRRLAGDRRLFGFVSQSGRARRLESVGNRLNTDENERISREAAIVEDRYNALVNYRGPLSELLGRAAKDVAEGGSASDIADRIYPQVKDIIAAEIRTGPGSPDGPAADERGAGGGQGERPVPAGDDGGGSGGGLFDLPAPTRKGLTLGTPVRLVGILKARDVSGEARVPAGSPHGGEWTKGPKAGPKAGEPHPQGYHPSTAEDRERAKQFTYKNQAVPVASWDLKVYEDPHARYAATWRDAAGRQQQAYSPYGYHLKNAKKFSRLKHVSEALPSLRQQVEQDLKLPDSTPARVRAAVVVLLDKLAMRIGSQRYAKANETYGASSLLKDHVTVEGDTVRLQYVGKHAQEHAQEVKDPALASAIRHLLKQPGRQLFQERTAGGLKPLSEQEVRDYLGQWDVDPKEFRTYKATKLTTEYLLSGPQPEDAKGRAKRITEVVKQVASIIEHKPEECRESYINPAVLNAYRAGLLKPDTGFQGSYEGS